MGAILLELQLEQRHVQGELQPETGSSNAEDPAAAGMLAAWEAVEEG
jgi:hypothetical protein